MQDSFTEDIQNYFSLKNGDVVKIRNFPIPFYLKAKKAHLYHYLTQADEQLVEATALYLLPKKSNGRFLVFAHGTLGVDFGCGLSNNKLALVGHARHINKFLRSGYTVIAPDYRGLGSTHAINRYFVRADIAYDILDAVKAAFQFNKIPKDTPVSMFGWSQGGHGVLSSAEYCAHYYPSLKIVGTVLYAPMLDLNQMKDNVKNKQLNLIQYSFFPYFASAIIRSDNTNRFKYTEIFKSWFAPKNASESLPSMMNIVKLCAISNRFTFTIKSETFAAAVKFFEENSLPKKTIEIPVFLVRGNKDNMVNVKWADEYKNLLTKYNNHVEEYIYNGGHLSVKGFSQINMWLDKRYAQS